jgi:twitching motility two-component system response regulator PilH
LARKILLADDSVTAQNMGRKILTDAGYEVVTVNNGSAALKKITEQRPDLIVLDVYMPGYSGLEVCQRIKENRETSRIPILLTVGKLEPFKPEEARRARADAFVVKPFEASELLSALTKLEDKIVPQPEPYKPGRFAKAVAAVDSENGSGMGSGESDDSWKARLQIPRSTPQERESEPDVDYAASQGKGFRDFFAQDARSKRKSKARPSEPPAERPIPAGLPQDITPEEIAAITAAAARLNAAPPAVPAERRRVTESVAETGDEQASTEEAAPVTFASAPAAQARVEKPTVSAAEFVADVPSSSETNIEVATPEPGQTSYAESEVTEPPERAPQVATDLVADLAAPAAMEETQGEPLPTETAQADAVTLAAHEPPESVEQGNGAEDLGVAPPVAPEPVPALSTPLPQPDDDVMAALQSLMPAGGNDGESPVHLAPDLSVHAKSEVPVGVAADASAIMGAYSQGHHWIAEEVALAAGEAALSLEKEMRESYAAFAATESAQAASISPLPTLPEASSEHPVEVALPQVTEQLADHGMASAAAAGNAAASTAATAVVAQDANVPAEPEAPQMIEKVTTLPESEIVSVLETTPDTGEQPVASAAAPVTEESAGTEEMVAQWKNIRDSIARSAANPGPMKESVHDAEFGPSVAAPETTATPAAAPSAASDPTAIASIVDSVLAELRPKIVAEIARQLADPKKD